MPSTRDWLLILVAGDWSIAMRCAKDYQMKTLPASGRVRLSKVLFATDFSLASARAMPYALTLGSPVGSQDQFGSITRA
jgi:hypothetical protein